MGIANSKLPVIANATINPSTIVMVDPSRDNAVIPAVNCAVQCPCGVVGDMTKYAPNAAVALGGTLATNPLALQGDEIPELFWTGDVCKVIVGSANVTAGDLLMPDGNSGAITATAGHFVVGHALQSGATGNTPGILIDMYVNIMKI